MTYPDPAHWAEKQTDAGTRPAVPIPAPVDDQPQDERWKDDYEALRSLAVNALRVAVVRVAE
jgi:hypothetical protein